MKPIERNIWRGMDEEGVWHEGTIMDSPSGAVTMFVRPWGLVAILPHTVGQWTTKEIDDKKLFEGDIIAHKDTPDRDHYDVYFGDDLTWRVRGYQDMPLAPLCLDNYMIVGNVHD